jgi:hypothetical protein
VKDKADMSTDSEQIAHVPSDVFSLELFEQTLLRAKQLAYRFPTVSQLKCGTQNLDRFLLLRHDIDTSPRHALKMAELEHRLGAQSSYFVLMHSQCYNPAASPHWDALREIIGMGFEVGLHYETDFFENRDMDPLTGVLNDAKTLESILGIRIVSVSQHRPASSTFLQKLNEHYVDAYNNDLVHAICYISDSGFKWRGKSLLELLGKEEFIHALIHPLTWSFGSLDMAGTYRTISAQLQQEIRASFEAFISSTNRYLVDRDRLDQQRKALYAARDTGREQQWNS